MESCPETTAIVPEGLWYLPDHQVLVCLPCRIGIRPGASSKRHLQNEHQMKGQPLKDALQYISTLQL
jgi:hypothetical protein